MYKNLEKKRREKRILMEDIARELDINRDTIYQKIHGRISFKFHEAVLIKNKFFPECDIFHLFSKEVNEDDEEDGRHMKRIYLRQVLH